MAFPVIAGFANALTTTNSTSINFAYPSGIQAGELLVAISAVDGNAQLTVTGWTEVETGGPGAVRLQVFCKFAAGTESGNFTLTASANEQASTYVLRITGAHPSTLPPQTSSFATGTSSNPDSASCNPSTWDVEDTLWIDCLAIDTSRTVTTFPSNCPNNRNSSPSGGAGGATCAFASATSATSSFDAGAWIISNSDDWAATVIAVRPAAATKARPIFQPRARVFQRSF